ncbi:LpqN/LpqT family lipoprotein [Mycobacterium sp. P7213]|uniref:LpqN/LpqT family lipoprotein n=1 Tax=Mycobacterium sp. P7213 TaxID=2478465 RepID=UPI000F63EF65|nr:LpqN/LpqT family lipoprotein [Mycobacterium sp. P7213]
MDSQTPGSQGPIFEDPSEQPASDAANRPARPWLPVAIAAAALVMAIALIAAALIAAALIVSRRGHEPQSSHPFESEAFGSSLSSRCSPSAVPLAELDHRTADEPRLALPRPPGWALDPAPRPPAVRAVMKGPGIEAHRNQPNAVVTLENLTGAVRTAQEAIDWEIAGLSKIGVVVDRVPSTVCGYPAATLTYDMGLPDHEATCLIVAGRDSADKLWAAVVTVQSFYPGTPDYVSEKHAILSGFQFAFAGD